MIRNPVRLVLGTVLALTTLLAGERTSASPSEVLSQGQGVEVSDAPPPVDIEPLTPAEARRLSDEQLRSFTNEAAFVRAAVSVSGLTAAQARRVYRQSPELMLSIPTSVSDTPTVTTSAATGGTAAVRACRVRSTRKVRNNLGFVMFSFTLEKTWTYNGRDVLDAGHRHSWNITGWGVAWHFNGIVDRQSWWHRWNGRPHGGHAHERTAQFSTHDTPFGAVRYNVRRLISGHGDGSWSTLSARKDRCS